MKDPRPTGKLEGRDLPDRGTSTGFTGYKTDMQGTSIGVDDTNSRGKCGECGSDPADLSKAKSKPRI